MKTDIEIAYAAKPQPIDKIAKKLGITELHRYGDIVAKVEPKDAPKAKIVLVTAINPTPAGEGKSTVSIGLADGLNKIGVKTALALREPSLGPVFGMKGGATGGGMAQIVPMDDINLHFTGDLHAITSANNLLCAMVDNSIYFGNPLKIAKVTFNRCMDCNDRALRSIVVAVGGNARDDGFNITAASEVMATLCLAADFADLKERLGRIIVGYDYDGKPVTAKDLGAEKFFDVKCRVSGIRPSCTVLVATVRALKYGGDGDLSVGMGNLIKHIDNLKNVFGQNVVVAVNRFTDDTDAELKAVADACREHGAESVLCECWANGGAGAKKLAEAVVKVSGEPKLAFAYDDGDTVMQKVEKVATKVYGASGVVWTAKAKKNLEKMGADVNKLPVCIAKTQYSLSDDPKKLGRPEGFTVTVRDVQYRAGAGFVVAVAGDILLMPGLPKRPNAVGMTIDGGKIGGLF